MQFLSGFLALFLFSFGTLLGQHPALDAAKPVQRFAFGSCANQRIVQPIWDAIRAKQPDLFLFLGDNVYGDTRNMDSLRAQYAKLAAKPGFAALAQSTPIIATWDDHDFGWNDSGRNYPEKTQSKEIFLEFFNEPALSERREHTGIYTSYLLGPQGKRTQFIVLDLRTFRSEPVRSYYTPWTDSTGYYTPDASDTSAMLGGEQWRWLEKELRKPADLRFICSSTQFASEFSGYELWALYPKEKTRMLNLLRQTKANGVVFLTGDIHTGELSVQRSHGLYPLYDLTSSGITNVWAHLPVNRNRMPGKGYLARNFGFVEVDWQKSDPEIKLQICSESGEVVITHTVRLSELKQ